MDFEFEKLTRFTHKIVSDWNEFEVGWEFYPECSYFVKLNGRYLAFGTVQLTDCAVAYAEGLSVNKDCGVEERFAAIKALTEFGAEYAKKAGKKLLVTYGMTDVESRYLRKLGFAFFCSSLTGMSRSLCP